MVCGNFDLYASVNLANIGSDNGLSPIQGQVIIRTKEGHDMIYPNAP